ncbi:hypothetical protein [Pseudomonas benzenivorans]|uniref:Lipoprotein n=1 Tax=Pseudomonas benzenivorans TaxID=556533 RepID=A0ABY5H2I8_9PSED|nr:hypothetical protein [Pseudomonas benzenivorans]UTW06507.1 hypothetical protein KDW96_15150 [Pseudomonas benzenivorans]
MSPRPLAAFALAVLLAACASAPDTAAPPAASPKPAAPPPPVPEHLRELSGLLLGVPSGAEVELALLTLDQRGLPQRLLGNIQLSGNGRALPFRLSFNPHAFPRNLRVELRGRAHHSGRLILRLPPLPIRHADNQGVGSLRLVPAP